MSVFNEVFIRSVETAVGQSMSQSRPLMVCITPTEDDTAWIDRLLTGGMLAQIAEKAVCLRLVQGTQEFHMFEQFFASVVVPSLYCIRGSSICDVLLGVLNQQVFEERVQAVLDSKTHADARSIPAITSQETTPAQQPTQQSLPQYQPQSTAVQNSQPGHNNNISADIHPSSTSQSNKNNNKTFKEQVADVSVRIYREEQLRKTKAAREEKERIQRLLKADKEERRLQNRLQDEERERKRRLSNDENVFNDEHCIDEIILENKSLKDNIHRRASFPSDSLCALSIRLLDGSSLKHNFQTSNTLNDVREWIDMNRTDGDEPYCFHRTIPRTTFGVTDEEKTLESLELTPRSALILKPFVTYTNAMNTPQNQTRGGLFSRIYNGLSSYWGEGEQTEVQVSPTQTIPSFEPYRDNINTAPTSGTSSQFVSPLHSPIIQNNNGASLDLSHPSALNLNLNANNDCLIPQRSHTPHGSVTQGNSAMNSPSLSRVNSNQARIRTLNRQTNEDRATYNGNHINLEDDSK